MADSRPGIVETVADTVSTIAEIATHARHAVHDLGVAAVAEGAAGVAGGIAVTTSYAPSGTPVGRVHEHAGALSHAEATLAAESWEHGIARAHRAWDALTGGSPGDASTHAEHDES